MDSANKGHLPLSEQHDMHGLNFSIQINLPTKYLKDNTECNSVLVIKTGLAEQDRQVRQVPDQYFGTAY